MLTARFSWLALCRGPRALALVALPLGWVYVGSLDGLVGTAYGSLVVTKVLLLGVALVVAASNLTAVRGFRRRGAIAALRARVPYLLETRDHSRHRAALFTAAQPVRRSRPRATRSPSAPAWREVIEVFRPKFPSLRTPSVDTMLLRRPPIRMPAVGGARTPAAYSGRTSATTWPGIAAPRDEPR